MAEETHRVRQVLGYNLMKWRRTRGLSMERLANLAGLYRTGFSKIEKGQVSATIDSLEKLSKALGIHVGELLREPEGELKPGKHFELPRGRRKKGGRA